MACIQGPNTRSFAHAGKYPGSGKGAIGRARDRRIKIDRRRQVDIGMKHGLEIPGRCETHEKHFEVLVMKPIMSVIWPF